MAGVLSCLHRSTLPELHPGCLKLQNINHVGFLNRANVTVPVSVMPISHESPVLSPADMYVRSLLYRMLES